MSAGNSQALLDSSVRSRWLPRWAAGVTLLGAFWSLLSILWQNADWPHYVDDAFGVLGVPVSATMFMALLLLLVSGAMRRRLRVARWAVILIESATALLLGLVLLAYVLDPSMQVGEEGFTTYDLVIAGLSGVACVVIVILFVRAKDAFPARTRKGSIWAALATLAGGVLAAVAVVFIISLPDDGSLVGAGERFRWAVRVTTGFDLSLAGTNADHAGPAWLGVLGGLLGAGALLAAVAIYLRSGRLTGFLSAQDELHIRALLAAHGDHDSLSYFATRRDKSVVFSPDGQAAVTYRVVGSVALASGDPVGAPASWSGAVAAWLAHARAHAWHPAVLGASESGARVFLRARLKARPLGDEAILMVDNFGLEGRAMRPVKRSVGRVYAAGYTLSAHRHAELTAEELAEIGHLADLWRGDEPDRGFSMALNRFGDRSDGRCVVVLARDATGTIKALQSFVPWGSRGLSLDLMRRAPDAVNGVNEAIVAALVDAAPSLGVRRVSLNFAMFRGVFSGAEQVGAGPLVRIADKFLMVADRFWQLDSLYRANAKYQPDWLPRFLCYETAAALPQVALASGVAEGFLPSRAPRIERTGAEEMAGPDGQLHAFPDLVIAQDAALFTPAAPVRRLAQQQRVRHTKLDLLRTHGMEPYPVAVARTTTVAAALAAAHASDTETVTGASEPLSIVGRVRAVRDFGGVTFGVLDEGGVHLQVLLAGEHTPRDQAWLWRHTVDLGDLVSVTGHPGRSRSGQPSLLVTDWAMASKCLRPLPDARAGFTDPEARVRQRYLDLIVNPESMAMMQARSRAVAALRAAFVARGFAEVETPMLQAIHGGATARPFRTHINAYNADLYLRIAPELFLKHLCVGGMSRIFELNRNFRNEGADATHNPEFTSVEAYAAHEDYVSMRVLTRELILDVATAVHGEPVVLQPLPDGSLTKVRIDGDWPVVSIHEAVSRATGVELTTASSREDVCAVAAAHGVHAPATMTAGEIVLELYDELVEKQTTFPTFYTDFPLETSPLTRRHRSDPALSERWDLVAFGAEIGTAYSELIDPVDQRQRLTEQSLKAAAGDLEAMEVDEAFLTALEYAMPPTGGLGIGVDRLIMMLTGANIRATLAFPFVKPDAASPQR